MATNGNQQLLSGNYGKIKVNGKTVGGFKNWTANYGVNLSAEGQFGTGDPILVPGLNSVTITITKLMLYGQSLVAAGIEPQASLNQIRTIPPFTTELYDNISGQVIAVAVNCMFDSKALNAPANAAFTETVTIMGTDAESGTY